MRTKEEVFGCGEGGHAGSGEDVKCLLEVYGESSVMTPDRRAERRRRGRIWVIVRLSYKLAFRNFRF